MMRTLALQQQCTRVADVQVCKFYLQGNCAYGNKCRFDHKRPQAKAAPKPRAVAPPPPPPPLPPGPPPAAAPSQAVPTWRGWGGATTTSPSAVEKERAGAGERRDTSAEELSLWDDPHAATTPFEERPLCSMALKGACPRGDACPYLHGEVSV
jgi:E3 ubiquitin-protein ligase makorin